VRIRRRAADVRDERSLHRLERREFLRPIRLQRNRVQDILHFEQRLLGRLGVPPSAVRQAELRG
jgi:hypothetical protein